MVLRKVVAFFSNLYTIIGHMLRPIRKFSLKIHLLHPGTKIVQPLKPYLYSLYFTGRVHAKGCTWSWRTFCNLTGNQDCLFSPKKTSVNRTFMSACVLVHESQNKLLQIDIFVSFLKFFLERIQMSIKNVFNNLTVLQLCALLKWRKSIF